MGIFNLTDEEKKQKEEKRLLVSLRDKFLYSNELDKFTSSTLVKYLNGIINGNKRNDFFDIEFLVRVFEQLTYNEYANETYIDEHLDKIISCLHDFFPQGNNTENYEGKKEFFINNLVGIDGYINLGVYDYDILNLFDDFSKYARIMTSISRNEKAVNNFNLLKKYIKKTGKYALDEESLVKAIVSTVSGLDATVINVDSYLNYQLDEDKKRVGVYSISHDDIMSTNRSLKKMKSLAERANNLLEENKRITNTLKKLEEDFMVTISSTEKSSISNIITSKDDSLQEIVTMKADTVNEMKRFRKESIDEFKKIYFELKNEIKNYLLDELENVKNELNEKADLVFSEVLQKYQEQLEEFRRAAKSYSLQNTRSLTALKNETDKSITQLREELQKCIDKAEESSGVREELKEFLDKIDESSEIRDAILEIISKEGKKADSNVDDSMVVQGINRMVVPATPIVEVPNSIIIPKDIQIISPYSFKDDVEYHYKLDIIKEKMKENEAKGEIYHKEIIEIIECLMMGNWPYIFGPSGAGKGYIVKQISELLGQKVIDGGKIGEIHTVFGYIDAFGRFVAPPAVKACVNGDLLFFDEFDNGMSDTRVALNTMYSKLRDKILDPSSEQYIIFANEQVPVPINPNMRMIAAGNTDGNGSDEEHTERYPTDESVKERYRPIYIPYDNRVEERILHKYKNWYDFFVKFREACESYSASQNKQTTPGNASTRDASDILRDVFFNAKTLDQMMCEYFVQIKDEDYRNAIAREIADVYSINYFQQDASDYNGSLAKATREQIAKQFVKRCNLGLRG